MLREQSTLLGQIHKLLDISLTAVAFMAAYSIKLYLLPPPYRGLHPDPNYFTVLLLIIIIWYVTFSLFNLNAPFRKQQFREIFLNLVKAVVTGMLVLALLMYLLKIKDVSRIMMGIFFLLNISLLTLSKGVVYNMLSRFRKKGFNSRNILLVGSRQRAKEVIDSVEAFPGSGYRFLGCLELEQNQVDKRVKNGIQVIGTLTDLKRILREKVVDELVFTIPLSKVENADQYMTAAEEIGVPVRILPDRPILRLVERRGTASMRFEGFLGIPMMALVTSPPRQGELLVKSALDYLLAAIVFILSLPLFPLIACAIKLSSKGPVFYKQERYGLNGRKFMLYKFRTMVADAQEKQKELEAMNEADGPVFKLKSDPRIIPVIGVLLRKIGLDELPQLINVLRGEMSLVGPRPPIPAEVERYDFWQQRRLSMKPGITCLWQCSPDRNEVLFDEWMNMDLKYIDNWSLKLDLRIMFRTALVMLMGSGR